MKDVTKELAEKTYAKIDAKVMESLTNEERTKATLAFVLKYLNKNDEILDSACGYGRITIPLAKKGHKIKRVDLVASLIKSAESVRKKKG